MPIELPTPRGLIRIFDEPTHRPGSRDNVREYERYVSFTESPPTSIHGELQITRLTSDGKPVWSASGSDVFSEGFSLHEDYVEAVDFDYRVYRFDYESGKLIF